MVDVLDAREHYLSQFAQFERDNRCESDPVYLTRVRTEAMGRFVEEGFPTTQNEDWKFTNVAPIANVPFKVARGPITAGHDQIRDVLSRGIATGLRRGLLFVNGACDDKRSNGSTLGLELANFAGAFDPPEQFEPYLGRYAHCQDHPFVALNTAFLKEGARIRIADNAVIKEPIYLVYASTAQDHPTITHPRNLIVVGRNSQVTLVESYVGQEGDSYFTNAVSEIILAESATVDHYKVQRESLQAFHVATLQIQQAKGSKFSSHYIGLGGRLVRHEARVVLDGEGCECTLNGLYLATGTQHMDNHTVIDHAMPHCASHELYKGILDGKARGVFNGKIYVHQDAQKTDAKQTNQTLLLSDDAVINTKPQLEIYADDVKCTHGATVGQLEAEAIFYLRSRGIGLEEARNLLTFAFANDIVARIKIEPVRVDLERQLLSRGRLPAGATQEAL